MSQSIQLIVGLGNPGSQYVLTRHNVGFWFIDQLADQLNAVLRFETKFQGEFAKTQYQQHPIKLLKPTTFMNCSGRSISAVARFYKIPASQILVVHDELDFPNGKIQLKEKGGHGGHNGLRDIISALGTDAFWRLRIGISHPGDKRKVHDYVLHAPGKNEQIDIMCSIDKAFSILPMLMQGEMQKAMSLLNQKNN